MAEKPIRVVVADDLPEMLDSLARTLAVADDIDVVGTAGTGAEAVRLVQDVDCDVAVLDLRMGDLDGITAARRISVSRPHVAVIVLSGYADPEWRGAAADAGVVSYLVKGGPREEIHAAVRAAWQVSQERRAGDA